MVPCLVGQAFLPVRVLDRQECLSYKKLKRRRIEAPAFLR
jgi:hypothetical protein